MPGRLRTASRPFRTLIESAPYSVPLPLGSFSDIFNPIDTSCGRWSSASHPVYTLDATPIRLLKNCCGCLAVSDSETLYRTCQRLEPIAFCPGQPGLSAELQQDIEQ